MRRNLIPPPVWLLLWAALMWQLQRSLPLAWLLRPPWNRFGIALAALGVALDVNAVHRFRMARTTLNPIQPHKAAALVTRGSYRFSRNPMYLGLLLMLGGWGLWLGSLSALLCLPLFVAVLTSVQIKPEESSLLRRFGADYGSYMRRVRRWL